jgi:predicted DNA-binding transcriptional regulator AlpA
VRLSALWERVVKLMRIKRVLEQTGDSRSSLYDKVARGLFPRPVKLGGERASAWPDEEIEAILAARVASVQDDEIRLLVARLHHGRRIAYERLATGECNSVEGAKL